MIASMITDKYGQQVYTEQDICDYYLVNNDAHLKNVLVSDKITFSPALNLEKIPTLIHHVINEDWSVEEFDNRCKENWYIPKEYLEFDIAKFVLDQCKTEAELQRAGEELLLYQERDMFVLLQYMKYLVDTMRKNNIVWGVGRGSSVSSYVLYLIGIHRIDSLYYDLPIDEFLK
jgi:DNA polymerase III alpha subunit